MIVTHSGNIIPFHAVIEIWYLSDDTYNFYTALGALRSCDRRYYEEYFKWLVKTTKINE